MIKAFKIINQTDDLKFEEFNDPNPSAPAPAPPAPAPAPPAPAPAPAPPPPPPPPRTDTANTDALSLITESMQHQPLCQ